MINLELSAMPLPRQTLDQAKRLVGFNFDADIYHVLLFDFGDDGGALGIWREGDDFCARIPLDALVNFCLIAKSEREGLAAQLNDARVTTVAELTAGSAPLPRLIRLLEKQANNPQVAQSVAACIRHWRDVCRALRKPEGRA